MCWQSSGMLLMVLEWEWIVKSCCRTRKVGRSLHLCFCALSSWLQEELLSRLPSIVFDCLYCSVLSAHGVVSRRTGAVECVYVCVCVCVCVVCVCGCVCVCVCVLCVCVCDSMCFDLCAYIWYCTVHMVNGMIEHRGIAHKLTSNLCISGSNQFDAKNSNRWVVFLG